MRTLLEVVVGEWGWDAFDLLHCVGNLIMRKQVNKRYQRQALHAMLLKMKKAVVKDIFFKGTSRVTPLNAF